MSTNGVPPIKKYRHSGERVWVQAQQVWVILTGLVMFRRKRDPKNPTTIEYGQLARFMGYDDRRAGHTLGRPLGIVGEFCIANGLPPLNVIVKARATGKPGAEVVRRPGHTVEQEQAAVMKQNWWELRPPTTGTLRKVWKTVR